MRKLLSVLSSTLQEGVRGGLLFVALLATTTLWAYDFQSGDLYYNITSETTVEVTYQYKTSSNNYAGLTTATIPETVTYNATTYSVTSIGYSAFQNCSSLASIAIPEGVTSIGSYAFGSCSSLTSITIPNSVTSIGNSAFSYCTSLTSVTIPNSVTSIGSYAFRNCYSLTSVTIPNSVTSIGSYAFYECSSLTSITIPNSVTSIGGSAFAETPWYNNLSDGVIYLGKVLYKYKGTMPANTSITIEDGPVSISPHAFSYCSSLTSVTIGNSVTSIGDGAFVGCSSLTSITIPNSITRIGDAAFYSCSALTSVTIPNSVTSIGEWTFYGCSSLTSITIPNSVTSIGMRAFDGCRSIKTVICEAIEIPEFGNDVFDNMPLSEATLYVPAESLDDYKAADQWKDFGTILPIEGETEEEIKLQDMDMTIVFINSEDNDSEIYSQSLTIKIPAAPTIAGFTFLKWRIVEGDLTNVITIQAIYEADTPTSAEVYTNPANPAQKLLRNGQVYILQDGKTYTIMGQEL